MVKFDTEYLKEKNLFVYVSVKLKWTTVAPKSYSITYWTVYSVSGNILIGPLLFLYTVGALSPWLKNTLRSERFQSIDLYINVQCKEYLVTFDFCVLMRSESLDFKVKISEWSCNSCSLNINVFVLKSMVAFVKGTINNGNLSLFKLEENVSYWEEKKNWVVLY